MWGKVWNVLHSEPHCNGHWKINRYLMVKFNLPWSVLHNAFEMQGVLILLICTDRRAYEIELLYSFYCNLFSVQYFYEHTAKTAFYVVLAQYIKNACECHCFPSNTNFKYVYFCCSTLPISLRVSVHSGIFRYNVCVWRYTVCRKIQKYTKLKFVFDGNLDINS